MEASRIFHHEWVGVDTVDVFEGDRPIRAARGYGSTGDGDRPRCIVRSTAGAYIPEYGRKATITCGGFSSTGHASLLNGSLHIYRQVRPEAICLIVDGSLNTTGVNVAELTSASIVTGLSVLPITYEGSGPNCSSSWDQANDIVNVVSNARRSNIDRYRQWGPISSM